MSLYRVILSSSVICCSLILGGCSSSTPNPRKPMDTSGKSPIFVTGAEDGCATANGKYTKNHDAFNSSVDYHEGWFAGRRYCEVRGG